MTDALTHHSSVPARMATQLDFILLDASSSMHSKWLDSLAAIESFVATLRVHNLNTTINVTTCDSTGGPEYEVCSLPLPEWTPLSLGCWGGSTPLYDGIQLMCRKLRDLDPPRCSILIVTDGEENSSQFTNLPQAKALLDWCRAKGWQVTFIGCDFNNTEQARLLGANPSSAVGVSQALLSDATRSLAEKRARYGLYGTSMHFSEDERSQFGGYLAGPSAPPME